MAFQLLEKLFSLFHKPAKTKNKAALSAKQQKFWHGMTDGATNDLPPPYTDAPDTIPQIEKVPAARGQCGAVRICPHDLLSIDRLTTIANLPNIKTNGRKIDALQPHPAQHHRGHDKDTKEPQDSCKPLGSKVDSYIGSLKGFGTYSYKNDATIPGLVLSFHWEMLCLEASKVKSKTMIELQELLRKTNIQLCPHKMIADIEIVNAIYGIVNPDGKPADPIDRYLAKEVGHDCGVCGTKIKIYKRKDGTEKTCRVDMKKYLGRGVGANEAGWEAHCGDFQVLPN